MLSIGVSTNNFVTRCHNVSVRVILTYIFSLPWRSFRREWMRRHPI